MTTALTPRLAAIAQLVLPGLVMADIGTDHAYLPIALVEAGTIPSAIASDIAAKPLAAARENVTAAGLAGAVDVRAGSGLSTLRLGEAGTIVIAGMGGYLIRDIMAALPDVAQAARRFVLQPMRDAVALRHWLWDHGWTIRAERLAREGQRFYTAIAAERAGESPDGYTAAFAAQLAIDAGISLELAVELGPAVIDGPDPLLADLITRELDIVSGLTAELGPRGGDDRESLSLSARRVALAKREGELMALGRWLTQRTTATPET